jgi:G3E family GTPase
LMNCVLLPVHNATFESFESVQMDAVLTFSDAEVPVKPAGSITPGKRLHQLVLPEGEKRFTIDISEAGAYALFTEHHPDEFQAKVYGSGPLEPLIAKEYKPDHEHDEAVSSVGITVPGDLDQKKLNGWLQKVLMNQGPDIFRMKGVLSIKGDSRRFVFQGVHMLFDGRPDREWGSEPRHNSLIFIGRSLDRAALNEGFRQCLA